MNKYILLSIIIFILTNPVYAACTNGKITVNTNIRDASISIITPDTNAKKVIAENDTWNIGKGHSLTVQSFNGTTPPRTARFIFMINNSIIDDRVVAQGTTYQSTDFSTYVDSIFLGNTSNLIQFKYIYFFSEPYFWMVPQGISGTGTTSSMSGNKMYWESDNIDFNTYGTWKASYDNIEGYLTPPNETKVAGSTNCIEFTGIYRGGDIVITSNKNTTFTIKGPGGYSKSGGGTQWNDYDVVGGIYTVTFQVINDYITPESQNKSVIPGNTTYFDAAYIIKPVTGYLSITSSPQGAEVLVDNVSKGNTTINIGDITPGSHHIKCRLSGYSDYETDITTIAGNTTNVNCKLVKVDNGTTPGSTTSPEFHLNSSNNGTTNTNDSTNTNGSTSTNVTPISTSQNPEKPLITGKVLNAETGEPVTGAIISIGENLNTTGINGRYELRSNTGTYNIKATKSGYGTITKSININNPEMEIDFLLKTEGVISWWMIPIILLGVIIPISVIYIILNRRKKNKKKEIKEVKVEKVKNNNKIKDKRYCVHCKIQIPLDAEYCVTCGKKQEKYCMSCGAKMHTIGACPICKKPPLSGGREVKICKNCGGGDVHKNVLPIEAEFCDLCGAHQ